MATRYWVGGTGDWDASSTTNWAASTGGTGGASVPTSSDDVVFDTLSNATGYTCTITAAADCANLTVGNPLTGVLTFGGYVDINVYGNCSVASGVVPIFTLMKFRATSGTKTITSNGFIFDDVTFNGSGGTFQLVDQLSITSSITMTAGTFDGNSQTVSLTGADTSKYINGSFTFYDLTMTGVNSYVANIQINASQTITGTLTLNGNSVTNRLLVWTGTRGTGITLTAATVSVTNADFMDITGAGAGSWNLSAISGGSGDCGGNSGITFTTPANQYMKTATSVSWSASSWYTTSGGSTPGRVPLPQDTAIFDANSITAASVVITTDLPRISGANWTGVTNTPEWTQSVSSDCYGSVTLVSGMTLTTGSGSFVFAGRGSHTFTSAGKTWPRALDVSSISGTLTFQDAFNVGTDPINLNDGTLDTNGYAVTCGYLTSSNSATRTLTLGSSTVTISNDSAPSGININIQTTTNLTFNANTSTIVFTSSGTPTMLCLANNLTFYNFTINGSGNFTTGFGQAGNTISNNLTIDRSAAAKTVLFCDGNQIMTVGNLVCAVSGTTVVTIGKRFVYFSGTSNIQKSSGTVSLDYLDISNNTADGGATWYAGANSTDSTGNSGWIFTDPPSAPTSGFLMFM